jgi:extradiol dioxygenase family protein
VQASYERLRADGVSFNAPPLHLTEGAMAGHTIVYLRDPDGVQLELMQEPKES